MNSLDEQVELESRMYDAGYVAGQASVQNKYLQFRHEYTEQLHKLINIAIAGHEWDAVVYARQILRSLK